MKQQTFLAVSFLCLVLVCRRHTALNLRGRQPGKPDWPALGDYPDAIGLQVTVSSRDFIFCGGVLITMSQVLVTPQCFSGLEFICTIAGHKVHAGMIDYKYPNETHMQIRIVKGFIRHPDYREGNQVANAVMILMMDAPFTLTCKVRPALIPMNNPPLGTKCQLTFWRDVERWRIQPHRLLSLNMFVVNCSNHHTENYEGAICFADMIQKHMNDITADDVFGGVYCNYYTTGILLFHLLNNKSSAFHPVFEYPAVSLAYHRDWIYEVILSHDNTTVKRSLVM